MRPGASSSSLLSAKGRSATVQRWQRSAAGNGRARAKTRPSMLRAAVASVSRSPSCVAASAIAGYPVCPLSTATPITALACPHPTFAKPDRVADTLSFEEFVHPRDWRRPHRRGVAALDGPLLASNLRLEYRGQYAGQSPAAV